MKGKEGKWSKAEILLLSLFIIPFLIPQIKGKALLFLLAISFLFLLIFPLRWEWFKRRFFPFIISLATLTGFSLIFGASVGKLVELDIRCAGVFIIFSIINSRVSPSQILGILSKEGKPSPVALFFYLVFRYLSLVLEEGKRMLRASQARGGEAKKLFWRASKLFINYILRILKRSEVVAMAIEARGWEGAEELQADGEEIRLEDVSFVYPDGKEALRNINLRVKKGEKVALLGANGAGKSTLLWIIGGFLKAKGKVEVFGVEVNRKNLPKLRKIVGIVFEDPDDQLLMPTLLEDVMFGLLNLGYKREESERLAREELRRFGLEGYEGSHPHDLSQGEKRRASLAGVMVMRPQLLLLDEPSANLDARGCRELEDILKGLDTTIILATHDFPLARSLCTRAIVLFEGEIVYDGEMESLWEKKELLQSWGIM